MRDAGCGMRGATGRQSSRQSSRQREGLWATHPSSEGNCTGLWLWTPWVPLSPLSQSYPGKPQIDESRTQNIEGCVPLPFDILRFSILRFCSSLRRRRSGRVHFQIGRRAFPKWC